ncbi:hypothetical protein LAZ67_2002442 [Cordylochernes scorpioides]|uniref:Reverse transcriptase RNase H-like domain-containing protein n=1 Tax=Cordylochernes scorpioides TaxID=51811 RepID=A0ABY6K249_9ARAC|nr:hypothetical protein LAZ67_2002442 [Cordylochernes scorpioides]
MGSSTASAVLFGPCTNRLPPFPLHVKPYEGTTFDDEEDLKTCLNNLFDTRPGVLKQVYPDGKTYTVRNFSRSLRTHERSYSDLELQCLAIWLARSHQVRTYSEELDPTEVTPALEIPPVHPFS